MHLRSAVVAAATTIGVLACGDSNGPPVTARVAVTPASNTFDALNVTTQFTAEATDRGGKVVAGVGFLWLSHDTAVAAVTSTGLVTSKAAGTTTITATGDGVSGNALVTVDPAVAGLAFVAQPTNVVAGHAISPAVTVEVVDATGHRVMDAAVAVTLSLGANPGGATIAGTLTVTSSAGLATFTDVWLDKVAAGYALAASRASLTSTNSTPFAVSAAPVALAFLTQPGAAEGQVAFAPAIRVAAGTDRFGNPVPPVIVTLHLAQSPSGESLRGTTSVTSVNGVATFADVSLARPGNGFVLEAASGGATSVLSSAFRVGLTFVQIHSGAFHACGITSAAFAYCWGMNRDGELGDSTTSDHSTPVAVAGGLTFTDLSAGAFHTCARRSGGEAYCWGFNYGRLGDGTMSETRAAPTLVVGGLAWASLSAGDAHTCGITTAHDTYCWGSNGSAQLGDGTTQDRLEPTAITAGVTFAAVSAGYGQSCGFTAGNVAYCWGGNEYGELGDSTTTRRETPTLVAGGLSFRRLTGGFHWTCGITPGDRAYCWGDNFFGQLGDSGSTQRLSPTPVAGNFPFAHVHAGFSETCGVTTDSTAYCWGRNSSGQLGDGTADERHAPTAVVGGLRFAEVGIGVAHACGLTTDHAVYCWGDNSWGQLGRGAGSYSLTPVRVLQ